MYNIKDNEGYIEVKIEGKITTNEMESMKQEGINKINSLTKLTNCLVDATKLEGVDGKIEDDEIDRLKELFISSKVNKGALVVDGLISKMKAQIYLRKIKEKEIKVFTDFEEDIAFCKS